jgi:hypothetical protein
MQDAVLYEREPLPEREEGDKAPVPSLRSVLFFFVFVFDGLLVLLFSPHKLNLTNRQAGERQTVFVLRIFCWGAWIQNCHLYVNKYYIHL